jgi:predicted PurR-regulated permease PerM
VSRSTVLPPAPVEDDPPKVEPPPERVVVIRARSVLAGLGILLGVAAVIVFVVLAQGALTLVAISLFVALALNPAVEFFIGRGLGRGAAVAAVFALALVAIVLVALVLVPPLVEQVTNFFDGLPRLVSDITRGNGPLGFLERDYQVVERVKELTSAKSGDLAGQAGPVLSVVEGAASTVFGLLVIAFLTLFMLIEGPNWRRVSMDLVPERHRARIERIGAGTYKAVGGFVLGNLAASLVAGIVSTAVLVVAGVPYAIPLGLFVVFIELIPYLGPLVATVVLAAAGLSQGIGTAVLVTALMVVYHAIEGHTLRPLIYGRAVRLSPLAVLIAILIGGELAGILGALVAIPVAGALKVVFAEFLPRDDLRFSASLG